MERVAGIEPAYSAWKAAALPLCYTRDATLHIAASRRSASLKPNAGSPDALQLLNRAFNPDRRRGAFLRAWSEREVISRALGLFDASVGCGGNNSLGGMPPKRFAV